MKYFSMFSGIGGFELGIQKLFIENKDILSPTTKTRNQTRPDEQLNNKCSERLSCVGYSEIDKYAIQCYEQHFGGHKNYGNARDINPNTIPDFDLLIGGFPCQAFSIAGKRRGFEDTRGTLFFEIARILKAKQPRLFLLENVKGLLNHDGGKTFTTILQTIDELGYDAQWQVLNSKHFGVPQNRERVFIIGHLRGTSRPEVFPIGETCYVSRKEMRSEDIPIREEKREHEINNAHESSCKNNPFVSRTVQRNDSDKTEWSESKTAISTTVATKQFRTEQTYIENNLGMNMIYDKLGPVYSNGDVAQANRVYHPEGISTSCRGSTRTLIKPKTDSTAFALDANYYEGTSEKDFIEKKRRQLVYTPTVRRLTPTECERVQGFPEIENHINLNILPNEIWIDLQRSYVNVETKNPKSQKNVGNVGKIDLKENVLFAERNLSINNQQTNKPVQQNVRINCVGEKVQIHNQEKSFSFANYVTNQNSFHQHIKTENFVQLLVGINTTLKNVIEPGKEVLLRKDGYLIQVKNGKLSVKLSGKEIMQFVKDAKKDSTTLREHLKYIMLNPLNLKNIDVNWTTSFFCVMGAIIGCIQTETKINNSLNLDIYSRFGWTNMLSDTQRYKCLGNAVTVNVIQAIIKRLLK